ncbi:MAG: cation transporter [Betaproteobacteria bacterium]
MPRTCWLSLALLTLFALPAQAEPRTVRLDVQKMSCATCPITVRLSLKKTPGVIDAKVTLIPPVAEVTYDDSATGLDQLTRATANAGFPSTLRKQP